MVNVGLLIDPGAKTIEWVELPKDIMVWRALVGADTLDHATLRPPHRDGLGVGLMVDGEGLLRGDKPLWCFSPHPEIIYAGKGLLYEFNREGDTTRGNHLLPPDLMAAYIIWRDNLAVAGIETTESVIDHPVFGRVDAISHVPKFEPKK